MISDVDSKIISVLRLPLIIGVVLIHANLGGGGFLKHGWVKAMDA